MRLHGGADGGHPAGDRPRCQRGWGRDRDSRRYLSHRCPLLQTRYASAREGTPERFRPHYRLPLYDHPYRRRDLHLFLCAGECRRPRRLYHQRHRHHRRQRPQLLAGVLDPSQMESAMHQQGRPAPPAHLYLKLQERDRAGCASRQLALLDQPHLQVRPCALSGLLYLRAYRASLGSSTGAVCMSTTMPSC